MLTSSEQSQPASASRLILFDIDGTLLQAGRVSAQAFEAAIRELLQRPVKLSDIEGLTFHGRTDQSLIIEILEKLKLTASAEQCTAFFDMLPRHMEQAIRAAEPAGVQALPGAIELVENLLAHHAADMKLRLLTGNIEATALLKLRAAGFDTELFDLQHSAFGSASVNRADLVPIAAGFTDWFRVIVIGDTPADVACAKAHSAMAVAVATGAYSAQQLAQHDPDVVLPNLLQCQEVALQLLG